MTIRHFTGHPLSHPALIWCLFALILTCITIGLISLSEHTLRLSRERRESQARERLQQDTVVALWRLDSRLGPFIATLLDPLSGQDGVEAEPPFVKERFTILNGTKGRPQPVFSIHGSTPHPKNADHFMSLPETVSATAIMNSVNQLISNLDRMTEPTTSEGSYTTKVNVYTNKLQYDDRVNANSISQSKSQLPSSDLELLNRNMIVQQQIALNYQDEFSNQGAPSDNNATRSENSTLPRQWSTSGKRLMTLWVNDQLFVLRPARENPDGLDGVWVDWAELKNSLASEIMDLIPDANFLPVGDKENLDPAVTLAALPARLVTTGNTSTPETWSPTHNALLIAWLTLSATAVIATIFLQKLIALSERRATFVSAVTHELRTPLTTFRLYTELLSRNMVSDPAARKEYLETLSQESDRLTHLIDNVLRYSKLERTSTIPMTEVISVPDWIDRITPRLIGRLKQCGMALDISSPTEGRWKTDPPAMEQVIFNLIDNAAKYAKSQSDSPVQLIAEIVDHEVIISIADHGPGVPPALQRKIFQPFSKSAEQAAETAAGVGLGLALARQTAHTHGGTLTYEPTAGGGATFVLRTPMGMPKSNG